MVKFIVVNMAREHEKPSSDQVLTAPGTSSEPRTCNDASTLGTDVITALSLLTKMINQGPNLGPSAVSRASPCKVEISIWSAVLMAQYGTSDALKWSGHL